jgi:hypothetical protein
MSTAGWDEWDVGANLEVAGFDADDCARQVAGL